MTNLSEQVMQDQAKFLMEQEARLIEAGEFIQRRLKEALEEQGSKDHHATKGSPPLKQTGKLLNSIKVRVEGKDVVVVYSDVEYGKYLEKNHPWFMATIEECEPGVRKIIFGGR